MVGGQPPFWRIDAERYGEEESIPLLTHKPGQRVPNLAVDSREVFRLALQETIGTSILRQEVAVSEHMMATGEDASGPSRFSVRQKAAAQACLKAIGDANGEVLFFDWCDDPEERTELSDLERHAKSAEGLRAIVRDKSGFSTTPSARKVPISDRTREALEALGYLSPD